jgi:hypothetical protein
VRRRDRLGEVQAQVRPATVGGRQGPLPHVRARPGRDRTRYALADRGPLRQRRTASCAAPSRSRTGRPCRSPCRLPPRRTPAERASVTDRALGRGLRVLFVSLAVGDFLLQTEWAGDVLERLELNPVDARFGRRGEQPAPTNLLVVGIDDKTFDEARPALAVLAQPLRHGAGNARRRAPALVVYDVQFTEQSNDTRADNRLIEAPATPCLARPRWATTASRTCSAARGGRRGGGTRVRARQSGSGRPAACCGACRRSSTDSTCSPSPLVPLGRPAPRDRTGGKGAWIDDRGPGGHLPHVPFSDVVQGEIHADRFRADRRHRRDGAGCSTTPKPVSFPERTMAGPREPEQVIEGSSAT